MLELGVTIEVYMSCQIRNTDFLFTLELVLSYTFPFLGNITRRSSCSNVLVSILLVTLTVGLPCTFIHLPLNQAHLAQAQVHFVHVNKL